MKCILLAGATGYLGSYIAKELKKRDYPLTVIARSRASLEKRQVPADKTLLVEVTRPETLTRCCDHIDTVISTVGITRQKDGLTYMDVDYQANLKLLHEAQKSGVAKFIYVSVLNGEYLRHLKICAAKEAFVDELKHSGLDYCIIRPNGFFSDMSDLYAMAKKGRVYLFGNGELKANPIHGQDLAAVCVDAIEASDREIRVGGPQTLTQNEIAATAFEALGRQPKITHIPDWIRVSLLKLVRWMTSSKTYGPIEFFMTVMAMNMVAPEYGSHTLKAHFAHLRGKK